MVHMLSADKNGDKYFLCLKKVMMLKDMLSYLMNDEKYDNEMVVVEVDDELAVKTCKMNNYKYSIVTINDFVLPIL